MGIFDKIKTWVNGKIASIIFGITIVSTVYFVVSSVAKTINAISNNRQINDCDSFKYKVLNIVSIICLIFLACVTLPSHINTLIDNHKIMQSIAEN